MSSRPANHNALSSTVPREQVPCVTAPATAATQRNATALPCLIVLHRRPFSCPCAPVLGRASPSNPRSPGHHPIPLGLAGAGRCGVGGTVAPDGSAGRQSTICAALMAHSARASRPSGGGGLGSLHLRATFELLVSTCTLCMREESGAGRNRTRHDASLLALPRQHLRELNELSAGCYIGLTGTCLGLHCGLTDRASSAKSALVVERERTTALALDRVISCICITRFVVPISPTMMMVSVPLPALSSPAPRTTHLHRQV
ncbi:hypothetical protein BJ546DRAFT_223157 [Cryomyces antarcticus]